MKRSIIPFLSFIALPSAIQANIDPKVAEICMKAADFQGCVKSMSVQNKQDSFNKSEFDDALAFFKQGSSLRAIKSINSHLKKNPNEKLKVDIFFCFGLNEKERLSKIIAGVPSALSNPLLIIFIKLVKNYSSFSYWYYNFLI